MAMRRSSAACVLALGLYLALLDLCLKERCSLQCFCLDIEHKVPSSLFSSDIYP